MSKGRLFSKTITDMIKEIKKSRGAYEAKRLERAADEVPNLERLYQKDALEGLFRGDNARGIMTMRPGDFERYATPLDYDPKSPKHFMFGEAVDPVKGSTPKGLTQEQYIQYLSGLKGFEDVPFLEVNKTKSNKLAITGHEGRHRSRALDAAGEKAGLVQFYPRASLREDFPRRHRDEYIDALREELERHGRMVTPQSDMSPEGVIIRPDIELPDVYKGGGAVRKADGGIMDAIEAAKMAGKPRAAIPVSQTVDIEQMRREVEENARRVAQVKQELAPRPEAKPAYEPALKFLPPGTPESIKYAMGRAARNIGPSMTAGEFGVDVKPGGFVDLAETAGEVLDLPSQIVGEEVFTRTGSPEAAIAAMYGPGMINPASLVKGAASVARKASQAGKGMSGELATKLQKAEAPYATAQEGPFYRVRPRGHEESGYLPFGTREAVGTTGPAYGGSAGNVVPKFIPDEQIDELISQPDNFVRQSADQYAMEKFGRPYELPEMPESSLLKQGPIGRVFELAATDNPQYKDAVFGAYLREMPDVVEQAGARNYDELMARSYEQLAKETEEQFKRLPLNLSYHRAGEGNYDSSRELLKDVYGNKHMYVYQGGDPHDFLNKVDPDTGLNTNEMFRAVHDFYGHAVHGNQFGPKGEEIAWGAHSQMFSPLAWLAMSSETRGQNSFVNYTPINAELKAKVASIEARLRDAKKAGDKEMIDNLNALKKDAFSTFQFAPQKSVLLPPEFLRIDYNGGMPDYLQPLIQPAPETATSMPLTHFSFDPNLSATDPSKYGEGAAGREAARLKGAKGAVSERTYFYPGEPGTIERETQVGPYRYRTEASSLYDVSKDPLKLGVLAKEANRSPFTSNVNPGLVYQSSAMTDLERLAKEYGYEGILNPNVNPPMAMTYKSMPVQRQKKGGRVSMDAMRLAVGGMAGGGVRKAVTRTIEEARRLHEAAQKTRSKAAQIEAGLYHPIGGGVKLSKPTELMTASVVDDPSVKPVPRKIMTLEDLQGGVAIPLVGDRAAAGRILEEVEGKRLRTPVKLQGGPGFMQTHTFEGQPEKSAAWASGKGVVTALGNQARRAAELAGTDKVIAPYVAMSPEGVDYNTMLSRAILGQLDIGSLSKRAIQSFNKEVRKVEPRFVGIESPQLEAQLFGGAKEAGNVRKAFVNRMGLEEFRQRGFPDVAATRKAITEPELLHRDVGATGYNIARLDPEGRIVDDPLIPHETYPVQLRGEYMGSLEEEVPYREFFHGFTDKRRAFGTPEGSDWRAFSMSAPIQQLDQEWLDRVMKSMGKDKPREWKRGGQVKRMAEGGQITADDLVIEERKL